MIRWTTITHRKYFFLLFVEALNYSTNFLAQQKNEDVNEFKLATKFLCKEIENV